MKPISILLLEDCVLDAGLTIAALERACYDFKAKRVDNRAAFVDEISKNTFDLILADYALPDFDGMSALLMARERCPEIPFIIVSGVIGEEFAVEALQK